jgi:thioredoxin reductase
VTPDEFRRVARQQLEPYTRIDVRDEAVQEISGELGAFVVHFTTGRVTARRMLLCTGMVDDVPDVPGFRELWGTSIFQCPYCHAWEVQDRRFAYLAPNAAALSFAILLRGWTSDVVVLTDGRFAIPDESRESLGHAQVGIEERAIRRLVAREGRLEYVELTDGGALPRDVLFLTPTQRQVRVIRALGLELDDKGYVRVDDTTRETSVPGIHAAGDLASAVQGALLAAASGMFAAARLNLALTAQLATSGALT